MANIALSVHLMLSDLDIIKIKLDSNAEEHKEFMTCRIRKLKCLLMKRCFYNSVMAAYINNTFYKPHTINLVSNKKFN